MAGCAADDARLAWAGTIDTMADGRVVVHSPATGIWDADTASAWRLVEELRIGTVEGTGPDLFTHIADIDVDGLGRIWVLDRQSRELRVFASNGAHVRTIGREGSGPGEFRDPIGVAIAASGDVWVVDPRNARYAVFDSTGRFITAHLRRVTGYSVPWHGGMDDQGRLIEGGFASLIRHDTNVEPIDTFALPEFEGEVLELEVQGGMMTQEVPFAPTMVWTSDVNAGIWSGINGEFRIHQQTFNGDTVRVFGRAYQHQPVTDADREEAFEQLEWFRQQGGRVDMSRFPDLKPAFTRISVAPGGEVWVQVTPPAGETATLFDIFDPEGRYLGQLRSPTDFHPGPVFRGDRVYGAVRDSLGVSYVVVARILR